MIFLGTGQGAQCPKDFEEISTMPPPLKAFTYVHLTKNKRKGRTQKYLLHPSHSAVGFRMRHFWGVPHRPATEQSSAPASAKNIWTDKESPAKSVVRIPKNAVPFRFELPRRIGSLPQLTASRMAGRKPRRRTPFISDCYTLWINRFSKV